MAKAKGTKKANPVPADETKAQKFERLAAARVNKALSAIEAIGKLSGKSYAYSPQHVEKIVGALDAACEKVEGLFKPVDGEAPRGGFAF